jgi:hypothetical protein
MGEGRLAKPVEQLGPRGAEQVIAAERDGEIVHLSKRDLGPGEMAERDRAVQPDHWALRQPQQG